MKNKKKCLKILITLLLLWFIGHTMVLLVVGFRQDEEKADVALVLGSTVFPDGTLSPWLEARCKKGLELYQKRLVKKIIVSGGLGKEGHDEAAVMAKYFIENGVPIHKILIDNQGVDTYHSILFCKNQLDSDTKIYVVSQYFHVLRTKMGLEKVGFQSIQSVSPNFYHIKDLWSIPREFIGYYVYYFKF